MSRPFILDPLFRPLIVLPGIGPRNARLFEKLTGGPKVLDLLWHLPIDLVDRRFSCPVADLPDGQVVTLHVKVEKHTPGYRKSQPYRVRCSDETGKITLVFFHASQDWIKRQLPEGKDVIVSGKVEFYRGRPQIVHPDAIGRPAERAKIETVEPVYPLTQGVTNRIFRKALGPALERVPHLPEWLDAAHKERENWPDWDEALKMVHFSLPQPSASSSLAGGTEGGSADLLDPLHPARARLAYDELLSNQLTLALVRRRQKKVEGRPFKAAGKLRDKVLTALPFELTGAQKRSLSEIDQDMASPARMLRLLQGDVGSGKTVVAALAMLNVIENGAQAALMAPTEILARQHAESLKPWLEAAGIRHILLTGRDKGTSRDVKLMQIRNGAAQVVIGTHAIFQEGVEFNDLGLAVMDEQHRFGVHQRLRLTSKGAGTDILVMTATPIPRTLALTAYGDMDVSKLDEKPPGRQPVDTRLIPVEKLEDMVAGLKRQIETGARVYWVCPLVEESEKLDLAAAEERYDVLKSIFGDRVGLVHGRMKPPEKDAVMEKFIAGELDILVATTVIEVGVDVPEATIMVIEHAERFGLSQLHQLRGRVGRGADKSYCFLVYSGPLNDTAKERLSTMRETEDGFLIAERDLELRGGGDILGVRQSGMPTFRLSSLSHHKDLLVTARNDARMIIETDPNFKSARGKALRTLLYLFERDQAIQYLRSG